MKTPDKIKKGLEHCIFGPCGRECPYFIKIDLPFGDEQGCDDSLLPDTLAYIIDLESNDSQVKKALSDNGFSSLEAFLQAYNQVKAERDAAISDMGTLAEHQLNPCDICKHLEPCDKPCERALQMEECFEWRGVCESNGGTP
jgi:hypothetical protein